MSVTSNGSFGASYRDNGSSQQVTHVQTGLDPIQGLHPLPNSIQQTPVNMMSPIISPSAAKSQFTEKIAEQLNQDLNGDMSNINRLEICSRRTNERPERKAQKSKKSKSEFRKFMKRLRGPSSIKANGY